MGQTLSNGVYLPNEGERNCYAGLASNWQILNTAVGNIAEKAPLVHTHGNITNDGKVGTTANLPLITGTGGAVQAGAFGNQANTFCEGNDSRLSDARTPVAHTHTKSDVTDLFNSANEWTGINTYTTALRFSAANYSAGTPSSDIFYGSLQWGGIVNNSFVQSFGINNAIRTTGINDISLRVWSQTGSTLRGVAIETNADASNSSLRPLVNNVTDLGSSIYQWNNLYAKNYYYNGVAWGLDKNNKWLTTNIFYGSVPIFLRGSDNDIYNVSPQSLVQSLISFVDKNNTTMGSIVFQHRAEATETHRLCLRQQKVTSDGYYGVNLNNLGNFYPDLNNTINLGTSTNRWKTLNGISPGALSFPNLSQKSSILEYITDLTGGLQYYTPVNDGWICIQADNASVSNYIRCTYADILVKTTGNGQAQGLSVLIPVLAGVPVGIRVVCTALSSAYFYHCQGNIT